MSKITFRADDALIEAVEALDGSKSEIMRDALRTYLETDSPTESIGHRPIEESLDEIVSRHVDEILDERLEQHGEGPGMTVHVTVDGTEAGSATVNGEAVDETASGRESTSHIEESRHTNDHDGRECASCGVDLDPDHVYCPNCGDHAARAFYCECGEELRPDWSFCPGCGRRTASAEFLEQ